jgi:hypothetical protein
MDFRMHGAAIKILICIWEMPGSYISDGAPSVLTEMFCAFLSPSRQLSRQLFKSGLWRFPTNPLQLIIIRLLFDAVQPELQLSKIGYRFNLLVGIA